MSAAPEGALVAGVPPPALQGAARPRGSRGAGCSVLWVLHPRRALGMGVVWIHLRPHPRVETPCFALGLGDPEMRTVGLELPLGKDVTRGHGRFGVCPD